MQKKKKNEKKKKWFFYQYQQIIQNSHVPHYIFVRTKIEVQGICAVQEMSEFILLSEKRCHFLLFWCKSFETKSRKETLTMFWNKNKGLFRFV